MTYEILSSFSMHDYHEYCQTLNKRDTLTLEEFGNSNMGVTHFVDIQNCFVDNVFNPNHVLDYFTWYSDLSCLDLPKKVLELVRADLPFWTHVSAVVLPLKPIDITDWLAAMENPLQPCDELFLFMLNHLHLWHMVIFTKTHPWSTICMCESMDDDQLYAESNIHYVYLGQDVYGEMKEKPVLHIPSSASAPASQFEVSTVAPILPEPIMVFPATDSQNGEQLNNDKKAKQNDQIQQKDNQSKKVP